MASMKTVRITSARAGYHTINGAQQAYSLQVGNLIRMADDEADALIASGDADEAGPKEKGVTIAEHTMQPRRTPNSVRTRRGVSQQEHDAAKRAVKDR